MKKLLFWDFDGTLVDAPWLWSRAIHDAVRRAAPDSSLTIEDILPLTREHFTWHQPEQDSLRYLGDHWWGGLMLPRFEAMLRGAGLDEREAAASRALIREEVLRPERYRLYPDALSTLAACRERGYRQYILSNNFPELEDLIRGMGLGDYFDGVVVSARCGYDKPRKELFHYALNLAEARPGDEIWMIGDNPTADIEGAKAAGMKAILVHRDAPSPADHRFATLREVLDVLP